MLFDMKVPPTHEEIEKELLTRKKQLQTNEEEYQKYNSFTLGILFLAILNAVLYVYFLNPVFVIFVGILGILGNVMGVLWAKVIRKINEHEAKIQDLTELTPSKNSKEIAAIKKGCTVSERLRSYFETLHRPPVLAEYQGVRWVLVEERIKERESQARNDLDEIVRL
ncbi:MAG: hypothetical protein AB7D06_17945 [Pedobacter sp.]